MSLQEGKVLATIPKNDREQIRVSLSEFKGKRRCDVRVWYQTSDGYCPGRQGISLVSEHLGAVLEALRVACRELAMGNEQPQCGARDS